MEWDTKSLYIKGLVPDITDIYLKEAFEKEVVVNKVQRLSGKTALIFCVCEADARKAIGIFNGATIHGCQIDVEFKKKAVRGHNQTTQKPTRRPRSLTPPRRTTSNNSQDICQQSCEKSHEESHKKSHQNRTSLPSSLTLDQSEQDLYNRTMIFVNSVMPLPNIIVTQPEQVRKSRGTIGSSRGRTTGRGHHSNSSRGYSRGRSRGRHRKVDKFTKESADCEIASTTTDEESDLEDQTHIGHAPTARGRGWRGRNSRGSSRGSGSCEKVEIVACHNSIFLHDGIASKSAETNTSKEHDLKDQNQVANMPTARGRGHRGQNSRGNFRGRSRHEKIKICHGPGSKFTQDGYACKIADTTTDEESDVDQNKVVSKPIARGQGRNGRNSRGNFRGRSRHEKIKICHDPGSKFTQDGYACKIANTTTDEESDVDQNNVVSKPIARGQGRNGRNSRGYRRGRIFERNEGARAADASEEATSRKPIPKHFRFYQRKARFDMEKLRYLRTHHNLIKSYETRYRLDIKTLLNDSCLLIRGHEPYTLEAFEMLRKLSDNFAIKATPLSVEFSCCFGAIKPEEIIAVFKEQKLYAGWDMRNGALYVCSDDIDTVDNATELIRQMVVEGEYPCDRQLSLTEMHFVGSSYQWSMNKLEIKVDNSSKSLVTYFDESLKKLKFALLATESELAVRKTLDDYFASQLPIKMTVSISFAPLVVKNEHRFFQHCSVDGVKIDFSKVLSSSQCLLESNSIELLDKFKEKLNNFIDQKASTLVTSTKSGIVSWLRSQAGQDRISEIDVLSNTMSAVKFENLTSTDTVIPPVRMRRHISGLRSPSSASLSSPTMSSPSTMGITSQPVIAKPVKTTTLFSVIKGFFDRSYSIQSALAVFSGIAVTPISGTASVLVKDVSSAAVNAKAEVVANLLPVTPATVTAELLSTVCIEIGDIATIQADAVVSSQGAIKQAIEKESLTPVYDGLQTLEMRSGKSLLVYHNSTSHWNRHLVSNVASDLKNAVEKSYTSLLHAGVVAYPAIGTGGLGYPPDIVASTMIETVLTCLNTYHRFSTDKKVKFVMRPTDILVHQAFTKELSRYQQPIPANTSTAPAPRVPPAVVLPNHSPSERVKVEIVGFENEHVSKAVQLLKKDFQKHLATADLSESLFRSAVGELTQVEVDRIYSAAKAKNVEVTFKLKDNNIKMEGLQSDNAALRQEIEKILHSKSTGAPSEYPPHWDDAAVERGQIEVELNSYTPEFLKVSEKFLSDSGASRSRLQITQILRIQNLRLYKQYEAQKGKVKHDLITEYAIPVERELWHGTDTESAAKICTHEFNRSFCGRNATAYGKGTYFATTSAYSLQYSSMDLHPVKTIILAKVATGRYKLGNSSTDRKNLSLEYHSTVNSVESEPSIFVVYHDAAAYPAYVIRFIKR